MLCLLRLKWKGHYRVCLSMLLDLRFLTFCLQMTAWSFIGLLFLNAYKYKLFSTCTSRLLVKTLIGGKQTFFSNTNTSHKTREGISNFLGVLVIQRYEQYLRLPSLVGRAKNKSFSLIKERIWKKLKGWKEKLLSQARGEILIKAVIQAIPTFTMSCFKLPKGLINEIEYLIRKFWWGYKGEQRKIYWVSWEKLCLPKCEGGMGF